MAILARPLSFFARAFHRLFLVHWKTLQREAEAAAAAPAPAAPPVKEGRRRKPRLPHAEARLAAGPDRPFEPRPLVIGIVTAVALTLLVYFGDDNAYARHVPYRLDGRWQLEAFAWHSGWRVLCCLLIPLVAVLCLRDRPRDYHLGRPAARRGVALAGGLALVAIAAVAAARLGRTWSLDHPLVRMSLLGRPGGELAAYLALSAVQLVAFELLFRGFFLAGLARTLGGNAIVAMAVPYCMILYGRPLTEVVEATGAGVLLGSLALSTRSVWPGALIQIAATWGAGWSGLGHAPLAAALLAAGGLLWLPRRDAADGATSPARDGLLERLWLGPVRAADLRAGRRGPDGGPPPFDWRPAAIMFTVALSLTLQEYVGDRTTYAALFPFDRADRYWHLKGFVWWSGWRFLGYVLIPIAAILCMPGERLRNYHLTFVGFFKHFWIYVVLYLLILPAIIGFGQTRSFYTTYPFYKLSNRSSFDFWCWQGLYALQFLSLEFFFRGFMLAGLKRAFGVHSIFVMIVPYCMIHYGKPFPETMGAIFAGIILGTLAMRTRSIWCGALIHVSVALSMDWMGLHHCPPRGQGACPS